MVAGPGFAKDTFLRYLELEAVRRDVRPMVENKSRIVPAHASSAFKGALREVLETPAVMTIIKDTKAAEETRALDAFFETLAAKPDRALYGPAARLRRARTRRGGDAAHHRRVVSNAGRRGSKAMGGAHGGGGEGRGEGARVQLGARGGAQLEITESRRRCGFPLPDLVDAELPPPF